MPDLEMLAKYGVGPLLAGSFLLLSLSVYKSRASLTAWLDARTAKMSEAGARAVGTSIARQMNGELITFLRESKPFEAIVDARALHRTNNRLQELGLLDLKGKIEKHIEEDTEAHERIARLEADVKTGGRRITALEEKVDKLGEGLASHTGEIKADLRNLDKKIDTSTTDTKLLLSQILDRMSKRRGDKEAT